MVHFSLDWDTEPLSYYQREHGCNEYKSASTAVSSLPKYKRSISIRSISRWEPISEDKLVEKLSSVTHISEKSATWNHAKKRTKWFLMENG